MSTVFSRLTNLATNVFGILPGANVATITQTTAGVDVSSGQRLGTNTNDTANAGNIGEFFENNSTVANSVTTAVVSTVEGTPTGVTLTAGCWDITGQVTFTPAATTNETAYSAWIGTATGTSIAGRDLNRNYSVLSFPAGVNSGGQVVLTLPVWRVTIANASTVTYYLKVTCTFTASTMTCMGNLRATRVR